MTSFKIYLTKSGEVAGRIARSFSGEGRSDDIQRVGHGMVNEDKRIPAVYHNIGYHYCVVELNENGEHDAPTYELTIC